MIDSAGNILVEDVVLGDAPQGIAFADGIFVVAITNDGTASIIDADGNILLQNIAVGNSPVEVASNQIPQARYIDNQNLSLKSKFSAIATTRGVTLSWKNISTNYSGFHIWREVKPSGKFKKINKLQIISNRGFSEDQNYLDINAYPDKETYFYKIEY